MHRIVAFILAVLYFGTTSGMVLNVHYCMGKVASVEFDNFNKDKCNKCGKKSKSCCRNEVKIIKNTDVHKQVADNQDIVKVLIAPINSHFSTRYLQPVSISKKQLAASAAFYSPPDIFLKNCTFRI